MWLKQGEMGKKETLKGSEMKKKQCEEICQPGGKPQKYVRNTDVYKVFRNITLSL